MSYVQQVFDLTTKLINELQVLQRDELRDEQIERVEKLLQEREDLLQFVQPPYNVEEQRIGKEMVQLNTVVMEGLAQLKNEVKVDIQNLNKQKQHGQKYRNPYGNISIDGMFLDKRN
jgi:flagellar protein FliT